MPYFAAARPRDNAVDYARPGPTLRRATASSFQPAQIIMWRGARTLRMVPAHPRPRVLGLFPIQTILERDGLRLFWLEAHPAA
jgi:hypothetical protein